MSLIDAYYEEQRRILTEGLQREYGAGPEITDEHLEIYRNLLDYRRRRDLDRKSPEQSDLTSLCSEF